MKVVFVKFRESVRIPGNPPNVGESARATEKLQIEHGGGLIRISYTDEVKRETRSIAIPAGNVAYMEFAPEPLVEEKPKK